MIVILKTYRQFLDKFFIKLEKTGIDISELKLDHLGYQASSKDGYSNVTEELMNAGEKIFESVVGARRVGIYKLNKPLEYKNYKINIVEIIEPKEGQNVESHWEHVEMIVSVSLEDFMNRYSTLEWDIRALDRDIFPMLILPLGNGMRAKFPRRGVIAEVKRQEWKWKRL